MKIAGKKNDGAWFRANKAIHGMTTAEKGALTAALSDAEKVPSLSNYFSDLQSLAAETGMEFPASPANASAMASRWVEEGIPRQVYMGTLSFTTYYRTGNAGAYEYFPNYVENARLLGKEIRAVVKRFLLGRRQIRDLLDIGLQSEGNPGGQPDSIKNN